MSIIPQVGSYVKDTDKKWLQKKGQNLEIAKKFYAAGKLFHREDLLKRSANMLDCARWLNMTLCPTCGRAEVKRANLCRDRFCPTCTWRLSLRRFAEMCAVMAHVQDYGTAYSASFLTLTVKNCNPEDLRENLKKMSAAWNRLACGRQFKKMVVGWARSLEITYNAKTNQFHPHYHVILLLDPEKVRAFSVMQVWFRRKWARAIDEGYEPITDFRYIQAGDDVTGEAFEKAICETYKYTVKPDDMADMPLGTLATFTQAVYNIRSAAYGGIIKAARMLLNFTDTEEPDDNDAADMLGSICKCGTKMADVVAEWSFTDHHYKMLGEVKDDMRGTT